MEWSLGIGALVLFTIGIIGQAFEMGRIRKSVTRDEDLGSPKIFLDKRNIKWYGLIGLSIILWYLSQN